MTSNATGACCQRGLRLPILAKCLLHNLTCVVQAVFSAGLAPTFWQDAQPVKAAAPVATRPHLTLVP